MLVGAGGNAGNQAAVKVIRAIAVGSVTEKNRWSFFLKECIMAVTLSVIIGAAGMFRSIISGQTTFPETIAITMALMIIVFMSIVLGALLPFALQAVRLDPAHSSTTIQVMMDIAGVLITCMVANFILHTKFGQTVVDIFRPAPPPVL